MKRLTSILLILGIAMILYSCGSESVESKYSKYRASFAYSPVNTIAPLNAALTSFGEYCTITFTEKYYFFRTLTNSMQVNRDAVAAYKYISCIGGFIVGRSSYTELGTGDYPIVCYDLVCANCYADDGIAKAMSLRSGGKAACSRCHRTYDINNEGIVVEGEKGRHLERYRIQFNGTAIFIQN